jgi:uncharacterized membrane protein
MHALLATSFNQPDKVSFYNIVLFLHVLSAIVAFGITFAYPMIFASLTRAGNVRHLAWWHRTQVEIERKIVSPAAAVLLICGIYLASDGIYGWKSTFVSLGLVIVLVIMGLLGAVLIPAESKAAVIAERAIGPDGSGGLGADYQALARRMQLAGTIASVLVVVAVFLMVTKLGAHS